MSLGDTIDESLRTRGFSVEMFGPAMQRIWALIAIATVVAEISPAAGLPLPVFYTYKSAKVVLFFLLGYCTTLAYYRFSKLNRGLLLALASATLIEALQALTGHGHRFSVFELVAKVFLIALGFAVGLDARYERAILIGPWRLPLSCDHIPGR